MPKKSIRFYNDRKVRATNNEDNYAKAGNYWRWIKRKMTADGIQLVSVTHDF